ncbi:MAG: elongation factor P hydroxylase [Enterovibrio sp.]
MEHQYQDLITIFNDLFLEQYETKLELGGDEPIYLPKDEQHPHHRIIFARGFFASALHEIAHWLIAGKERRLLEDFGYWYHPDGRSAAIQAEFEKVEIAPQAIEWILSASCGFKFNVSCDNLNGDFEPDRPAFTEKVRQKAREYLELGLPKRTQKLSDALCAFYNRPALSASDFA